MISDMKIKVIYENRKGDPALKEGWGFSCWIEWEKKKILFDTGGDPDAFFSNLEKLGLRLEEATHVVFSHKHWDHIAGLNEVVQKLAKGTPIFVPKTFPTVPSATVVDSFAQIDEHFYSLVLKGGLFLYEQILVFDTPKGLVILTGCAHPGIVSILEEAQRKFNKAIYFVMGGFHLFKKEKKETEKIVEKFKTLSIQKVAPCHCSGESVAHQFQSTFGEEYIDISTGTVLEI